MTKSISPVDGAICPIMTETQRRFLKEHDLEAKSKIDWLALENSGEPDRTFPKPVRLCWETDAPATTLIVSVNDSILLTETLTKNTYILENLLAGQTYTWSVNGVSSSFTTEDSCPRWIHAEGMSNIRDMGGWMVDDGRRIRQGLLYRGSEMDTHHNVTEAGLSVLNDTLKIKTDLDLRGEAVGRITSSLMGPHVNFQLIPIAAYASLLDDPAYNEAIHQIFDILADPASYPVYYHCWGGADRTGCLAFLIEALVGVSLEDRLMDYEMTTLSVWKSRSRNSELFQSFLTSLRRYGDDPTYREQSIAYLKNCGITDETLEAVKRILLDV